MRLVQKRCGVAQSALAPVMLSHAKHLKSCASAQNDRVSRGTGDPVMLIPGYAKHKSRMPPHPRAFITRGRTRVGDSTTVAHPLSFITCTDSAAWWWVSLLVNAPYPSV